MKEHVLEDVIKTLDRVNYEIAELNAIKKSLELKIQKELHDVREGSKTYAVGAYAVTVKTGYTLKVDAEEYSIYRARLPASLNPVKEKTSLTVSLPDYRKFMEYGSADDLFVLAMCVEEKESKPAVKVGPNTK